MKRILSTTLILLICLSLLSGCVKTQAVKDAIVAIDAIGEVTTDSKDLIIYAEKLYGILTEDEKSDVNNRITLIDARETYNNLQSEKIYSGAKNVYETLNNIALLCEYGMDDIYGAWHFGIYEADDCYDSTFYIDFAQNTPYLTSDELSKAADDLGFDTNTVKTDWQNCVYVVEKAIGNRGDYALAEDAMQTIEDYLYELKETDEDYTYYPKLKDYYSAVDSYFKFFRSPSGSFNQLGDTVTSYETNIRTYQSDLGFLFFK